MTIAVEEQLVEARHIPKVSIGMPVYNGEPYISDALDSLLSQTYMDFELIISDNASTDRTEAICREFAAKDARIRYVRHYENLGLMPNFQFVLDEAVGKYFMWAAVDDRRHPQFVELAVRVLDSDQAVGLCFSDSETVDLHANDCCPARSSPGFTSSKRKWFRYIFRLHDEAILVMYGLHRKRVLEKFRLANFDYFDLNMSHWYELNSTIKMLPLTLFTCGHKGKRIPYSITGTKISCHGYLDAEWDLLLENFNKLTAVVLWMTCWFKITKSTRLNNKRIEAHLRAPANGGR